MGTRKKNQPAGASFIDNGRLLTFRVKGSHNSSNNLSSENALYEEMVRGTSSPSCGIENQSEATSVSRCIDERQILLFARESTRTKFMYLGSCTCTGAVIDRSNHLSATLTLKLDDYDELMRHYERNDNDTCDMLDSTVINRSSSSSNSFT